MISGTKPDRFWIAFGSAKRKSTTLAWTEQTSPFIQLCFVKGTMTATSTATNQQQRITQEYFDELCEENVDVFDMSEEEAVIETIQQLMQSSTTVQLDHLSQTFPTSERGQEERREILEFSECLTCLSDKEQRLTNWKQSFMTLQSSVSKSAALFLSLLQASRGWNVLVQASLFILELPSSEDSIQLFEIAMTTLRDLLDRTVQQRKRDILAAFHLASAPALPAWLEAFSQFTKGTDNLAATRNISLVECLLQVLYYAVRQSEANKTAFMKYRTRNDDEDNNNSLEASALLVSRLHFIVRDSSNDKNELSKDEENLLLRLGRPICRLITSLCTFEPDLVPRSEKAPPMVSSAHANVMAFHQEEFVWKLHLLLKQSPVFDSSMVLALRAMAINNDIVQAVVAVGLLQQARTILMTIADQEPEVNESTDPVDKERVAKSKDAIDTAVAVVGLFRNVCANDQVKTSLCTGNQSIVESLVKVMGLYPKHALLQEHACGTIAAMALRQPPNAQALVHQYQAHLRVISALREHPQRAPLQRQGALAIRNLVSRSHDLRPILLQANAGQVLLQISAKHVSCQDEVYAALRDMGVNVGIVNVTAQEDGKMVAKHTEMFGESSNAHFRPVYD